MKNENYSNELNRLLTFMQDVLADEMPTAVFSLDYFVLAVLDQKDSFIYKRLDDNLTTMTMETLFNAYSRLVKQKTLSGIRPNREIKYDTAFQKTLEDAEEERKLLGDEKITSEHVFLAMLKDDSPDNKNRKIFNKAGIEYNILFEKVSQVKIEDIEPKEDEQQPQLPGMPLMGGAIIKIDVKPGENPTEVINNVMNDLQNGNLLPTPVEKKKSKKSNGAVDTYCVNLNKLAAEGKIDKLVGREKEVNAIVRVLGRRKKNNAILVGGGGVGKTSICEGLAYLIEQGEVPAILYEKRIVSLDMTALMAGTTLRGMFEERVKALLEDLKEDKSYILLIDGIDYVMGSKNGGNEYDISAMLAHSLDNGDIQVIGTADFKGYRNTFDKDPKLARRFQKIVVEPPTKEETIQIIESTKEYCEAFHNVRYSEEAVTACVELAERYITERNLPDSAIDIIDEVGSKSSVNNKADEKINLLRREINSIKEKVNKLKAEDKYDEADKLADKDRELTLKLIEANKKFEEKKRNAKPVLITKDDVFEIVAEKTGIPISKLSVDDKQKIATMDQRIKAEVIGQDKAVEEACRALKRNRVGLRDGKVILSLLAVGKTGVGKTLLAKKLAKEVFGDEDAFIRFDMSEYMDKTSVNKLIGANPGYVGYDEGGVITEQVKNKKHCVILLDEIEKADKDVYNIFLQVFDEGFLTDNSGQKVDFKNTIIILTSNVGTKAASELGKGIGFNDNEEENNKRILLKELKKRFPPEFLNRLDSVVYFNNLTDENLKDIIHLEMKKMVKRAEKIGYGVEYDESAVEHILDIAKEEKEFGARPIIRAIQDEFEDKITDLILANDYQEFHTFHISCKDKQVEVV